MIDATGHDAVVVKSLEERGMVDIEGFQGMWVEKSEDTIVENTKKYTLDYWLLVWLLPPPLEAPVWDPHLEECSYLVKRLQN